MQVDGAHSQVFVRTSIAISPWGAPAVFLHKYVYYESMCQHDIVIKNLFSLFYLYTPPTILSFVGLVRLWRHMFCVYLHPVWTINHSVNTEKQVAASDQPSHTVWLCRMRKSVYVQHPYLPRGFQKSGDGHRDIKTRRSLFMLLFIMVPSNPCLVHYTRAAICQHLAGGLQGSKQQIGCTEPTM